MIGEQPVALHDRFRYMVRPFTAGPAPLYAHLAQQAAEELEHPGHFRSVLEPYQEEPARRLLVLRLFAAVHGWVLAGQLPELARHYPSAGGDRGPEGAWELFRSAVWERRDELPALLEGPLQHNEPSRAAALSVGFQVVAATTGLPLRLLEVGTSAGLLLRWDHYRRAWWYPTMFDGDPPSEVPVMVQERRGCDLHPIDPTIPANRTRLRSYVWADLADHVRILEETIEIARRVPVQVDEGDGADWLRQRLAERWPGVATVVFHSLMRQSGPPASLERMDEVLRAAAARATGDAPLAHLRFEAAPSFPVEDPRNMVETSLTMWPGTGDTVLVTSDVNGRHVRARSY